MEIAALILGVSTDYKGFEMTLPSFRQSSWYRKFGAAGAAFLLSSCALNFSDGNSSVPSEPETLSTNTVLSDTPNSSNGVSVTPTGAVSAGGSTSASPYTFVGRFDMSDAKGPRFKFGGSKIGAAFTGTSLAVDITDTGTDLFNVVIDGGPRIILTVNPNEASRHVITSSLSPGKHVVWMTKRTESFSGYQKLPGVVQFSRFVVDPGESLLSAPPPKKRLIVASGDSGFTGWGADITVKGGADTCDGSDSSLANEEFSIPAQTANAVDAEHINLSVSGEGVVESIVDLNPTHQLPVIFDEILPPSALPQANYTTETPADVVVLSAAGDDLFGEYGNGYIRDPNLLLSTYVKWLRKIRVNYPKALIINCLSKSAANQDKVTLRNLYTQAITQVGDPNIVYYDFWEGTPFTTYNDAAAGNAYRLYWGCSGHPSFAGSQYLGKRLGAFIKTRMGWE